MQRHGSKPRTQFNEVDGVRQNVYLAAVRNTCHFDKEWLWQALLKFFNSFSLALPSDAKFNVRLNFHNSSRTHVPNLIQLGSLSSLFI